MGVVDFCYDSAGNLTRQAACGSTDYTYDAENRITTTAGVAYTYDGYGDRVKKSGGTIYWGLSGNEPLGEGDVTGNVSKEFIFFNGRRIARLDLTSGSVHFYFSDQLGSSNVVTNADGTLIEEESDFYPFGGERILTDLLPDQQYKFTGKERDPESGLDYFGARYYSSALGRFLQPDEFAGGPVDAFSSDDPAPSGPLPYADIVNPQSLNKYSYVYNNPLRYTDPNGHDTLDYVFGAVHAYITDNFFGLGRQQPYNQDSAEGQAAGDKAAMVQGAVEAQAGLDAAEGGGALALSGGGTVVVSVAAGAALHGSATAVTAAANFAKITPNPFGSKGAPDHQQTSQEEAKTIKGQTEVTVKTPGGEKQSRRIDAARTEGGKVTKATQVVRPTKTGKIPAREVRAAQDIQRATGVKPKMVPVRPLKKPSR